MSSKSEWQEVEWRCTTLCVTCFRPCIDLHDGRVKQIVGSTLSDDGAVENHVSDQPAAWFAQRYRKDGLSGGHVVQLGPGNADAALEALSTFPGGLQLGGGVTPHNAPAWLDAGASHVIVTSYIFDDGELSLARLEQLARAVPRERLVLDLSCRKTGDGYHVATDRWQTVTQTRLTAELLERLAAYAAEFLVHAADVEGLCRGVDTEVVRMLGDGCPIPVTYAGGARSLEDLELVERLSGGRVDLTFGSALDLFGGQLVRYEDCVKFNRARASMG